MAVDWLRPPEAGVELLTGSRKKATTVLGAQKRVMTATRAVERDPTRKSRAVTRCRRSGASPTGRPLLASLRDRARQAFPSCQSTAVRVPREVARDRDRRGGDN